MKYLIDTELLSQQIEYYIQCGFVPERAMCYAVLEIPQLRDVVLEAMRRIRHDDAKRKETY